MSAGVPNSGRCSTRKALRPGLRLCTLGDRPRIEIDCGWKKFIAYFDDCGDLSVTLTHAIRNDGLPESAAQAALDYCQRAIGSYEDEEPGACELLDAVLVTSGDPAPEPWWFQPALSAYCLASLGLWLGVALPAAWRFMTR